MACALSPFPNFSTSLHCNQWPQTQFPTNSPISLRLSSPPRHHQVTLLARAKFDKFDGSDVATSNTNGDDQASPIQEVEEPEDDSCLPSDLVGAIRQSGEASAMFVNAGGMRAIVELLIPELQFLNEIGAQADVWESSRVFLDTLMEESGGSQKVKAIFPDAGVAALLKYNWTDAKFGCASLGDRNPVDKEDEIVVMIIPDYQMLEKVEIIANRLSDDPPRPLIMWNPRLVSSDVGVGFNVRNLRKKFLSTFTTVYSMKPLDDGAIFRCYPDTWKVFYDDKTRPNRYLLAQELQVAPTSTDIEIIFRELAGESEGKEASAIDQAMGVFSSFSRFMKAISK
ncbi:adenylate kinase 5 [Carex littledalei]|uniref:Adenylate kinase 5 n=1 Tax=Carex littledalei TaxID=544730 RepID=A0A833RIZ4_9POAL|nr:adenylate kinase 5 [Carex littledalei]